MRNDRVPALTIPRVLATAQTLWRRDRGVLLAVAAPFLFLPPYAFSLLVPRPAPLAAGAGFADMTQGMSDYVSAHWLAYLLVIVAAQMGVTSVFALYAPGVATVGDALGRGVSRWPRALLASALVMLGCVLVLPLFPLVLARATLAVPLIAGGDADGRSVGALEAIGRSVRATAGHSWPLAGLALLTLALRVIAPFPFGQLDAWLHDAHAANPVALAVVDAAAAGMGMLAQLAAILVAAVTYRVLMGASRGI